jgi:hypothetical protein
MGVCGWTGATGDHREVATSQARMTWFGITNSMSCKERSLTKYDQGRRPLVYRKAGETAAP